MSKATNKAKQQARVKPKKDRPRKRLRRNPAAGRRFVETPLEENAKMYALVRMAQIALDVLGFPPSSVPRALVYPEGTEADFLPGAD